MKFDLLSTVQYGGCSAKLPAQKLEEVLAGQKPVEHPNLLVGVDTHDDAGVYKISDEVALIQTTDFFPPICSDPYEFGQIAAANALSDVYAMGGKPLTVLNLVMFPADRIPLDVFAEILSGGHDKVIEADALLVGGHTIDDYPPKYGLAVTGTVHPDKLITNANAQVGDVLLLTKPVGTGVIVAGKRLGEVSDASYRAALDNMKFLNRWAAETMQRFGVRSATDITGFGLLGHALRMSQASGVSFVLETDAVPVLDGAYSLVEIGCIPGVAFKNQEWAEKHCDMGEVDYNTKMLMFDAQTSGGLLMAVPPTEVKSVLAELKTSGYPQTSIVAQVTELGTANIVVR